MSFWNAVILAVTVGASGGGVPVVHVVETADAVYFEPTATHQSNIVWVYPKARTVVSRDAANATYLLVERVLRDVQLPADPGSLHPSWKGRQALFYQVESESECVLATRPEMRFIQQWVKAKGMTIHGTKRSAICSFSFELRGETPAMVQQLEAEAAAGTLIQHTFELSLGIPSAAPLSWSALHAGLVSDGVQVGGARSPELAAFELGLVGEADIVRSQPPEVQRSFLDAALLNLFGWDRVSPEVELRATAPAGQYEFPSMTDVIPL
ncbi:hypothetical protein JQX13_05660 [Archangium violaceum]|uniref:hypothetical protein n=1 Tax=Archangium violaceum TaxID=83451 RepID=UPI00193C7296|nr:hypothetical protein [Archangium violaceum]QRK09619.1 hypothetical protein JQX13_05660 [Archangium violaceum]